MYHPISIIKLRTKREIFTKIKSIQWTITQLWPLVTNRSNKQTHGQEIAFFLYCLIKADNPLANSNQLNIQKSYTD